MKHFAIIYDSKTGTTKQAAEWIAKGMQTVADTEARYFSIPDVELEFVRNANGAGAIQPLWVAMEAVSMRG